MMKCCMSYARVTMDGRDCGEDEGEGEGEGDDDDDDEDADSRGCADGD